MASFRLLNQSLFRSASLLRQCYFKPNCCQMQTASRGLQAVMLTRERRPSAMLQPNALNSPIQNVVTRMSHKYPLTYDFIRERILLVLRLYDKVDPDKLTLDSHFYNDLGLDSLDHVEIIMVMEDEFHFEIPDVDAEKLNTPRDILKYISIKEEIYPELEHHDGHGDGHH